MTYYQAKDSTCINCGRTRLAHDQFRDAKPPRCRSANQPAPPETGTDPKAYAHWRTCMGCGSSRREIRNMVSAINVPMRPCAHPWHDSAEPAPQGAPQPMRQMVGKCDRCSLRAPLFLVPRGELIEPYLCEACAKEVVK